MKISKVKQTFTGLTELDKVITLQGGDIGVIVAPTGCGKTAALLTLATNNRRAKRRSLVINLELVIGVLPRRFRQLWQSYRNEAMPDVTFADMSGSGASGLGTTVDDIDAMIGCWIGGKRGKRGCAVYIDAFDTLAAGTQGMNYNMRRLQEIAIKHDVVIWVTAPTIASAYNTQVLTMIDTAKSVHIHDVATLSLGLSGVRTGLGTGKSEDECYQLVSVLKCRAAPVRGSTFTVFRDSNGCLWDSQLAAKLQKWEHR